MDVDWGPRSTEVRLREIEAPWSGPRDAGISEGDCAEGPL